MLSHAASASPVSHASSWSRWLQQPPTCLTHGLPALFSADFFADINDTSAPCFNGSTWDANGTWVDCGNSTNFTATISDASVPCLNGSAWDANGTFVDCDNSTNLTATISDASVPCLNGSAWDAYGTLVDCGNSTNSTNTTDGPLIDPVQYSTGGQAAFRSMHAHVADAKLGCTPHAEIAILLHCRPG
jgi:hypothetical protein